MIPGGGEKYTSMWGYLFCNPPVSASSFAVFSVDRCAVSKVAKNFRRKNLWLCSFACAFLSQTKDLLHSWFRLCWSPLSYFSFHPSSPSTPPLIPIPSLFLLFTLYIGEWMWPHQWSISALKWTQQDGSALAYPRMSVVMYNRTLFGHTCLHILFITSDRTIVLQQRKIFSRIWSAPTLNHTSLLLLNHTLICLQNTKTNEIYITS